MQLLVCLGKSIVDNGSGIADGGEYEAQKYQNSTNV